MRNATVLAAISLIVLAACSSTPDDIAAPSATSEPSTSASSSVSPVASTITSVDLSEPIDHVHGLVATGPDQLVAGTHSGAMSIATDGAVNAQGNQRDDLMGMTGVAGTNTLASSGHPGQGSKYPNPMGLLTSSDAGKTWSPVSLQGETDFHALAISGKNVIGYGGGSNLMISSDGGNTWSEGAALQVLAVAYAGKQILATTQAGLQASTDGGKTFNKIADSPPLALISAGTGQAVLGLDTNGVAWRSSDNGMTWVKVGEVGQVQAIAAYDNTVGYAIDETRLVVIK